MDKELEKVIEAHKERISKINTPIDYALFFYQTVTTRIKRKKYKKSPIYKRVVKITKHKVRNTARYEFSKVKKTMVISKCEECGASTKLCVHHIDKDKCNNVFENLVVLCYPCHRQKHPELPSRLFA
jgi:5-methylcytosine-specific restriction endonuclease McrA